MHTLIVTAHPSTKGFTHRIAETIRKKRELQGHSVEICNLYDAENQLPYLAFEDVHDVTTTPQIERFHLMIRKADELIFIHPLWWGNMPAIMKNWLDNVLKSGFAFQYTAKGPKGLLQGKTARVFCTGGSPWWLYACILFPFFIVWRLFVLGFCGIKVKNTTYMHNSPKQTEQDRQLFLHKVEAML